MEHNIKKIKKGKIKTDNKLLRSKVLTRVKRKIN